MQRQSRDVFKKEKEKSERVLRKIKLMSSNKYQKVETNSSDSQEEIAEEQQSIMAHVSNIPSTHSSQQLMMNADAESVLTEEDAKSLSRRARQEEPLGFSSVSKSQWFTVGVLCFINLINYMDRFTIAGESSFLRIVTNTFKDAPSEIFETFVWAKKLFPCKIDHEIPFREIFHANNNDDISK